MRAEFVNPFLASLMNVLKTMASLELKPQKPRIKKDEIARGDVSGLIGMIGPTTRGSMSITFDESLALEIMQNMLGERPNGLNEEVTDMVGEITNMVTGGAKRILAESGFDFDMATPVVVSGRGHTIRHKCEGAMHLSKSVSSNSALTLEATISSSLSMLLIKPDIFVRFCFICYPRALGVRFTPPSAAIIKNTLSPFANIEHHSWVQCLNLATKRGLRCGLPWLGSLLPLGLAK